MARTQTGQKTKTGGRSRCQEGVWLTCLLFRVCSAHFFIDQGGTLSHQSLINKMPYMAYLQPKLMEAFFLQWRFLSLDAYRLVQVALNYPAPTPNPIAFPLILFLG